jgi:hypothetical protein
MCIRALDFLPPVDINFGDFLRALITADCELVPIDDKNYRVIFIEAFRNRGIYPDGIKTLSVESLRWSKMDALPDSIKSQFGKLQNLLKDFVRNQENAFKDRDTYYTEHNKFKAEIHNRLYLKFENVKEFEDLTGLVFNDSEYESLGVELSERDRFPKFFVESLAFNRRIDFNGKINNQAVMSISQKRRVALNKDEKEEISFYGGVTLIFDLDTTELLYAIKKDIRDEERLEKRRDFINNSRLGADDNALRMSFETNSFYGPFASLHNSKH